MMKGSSEFGFRINPMKWLENDRSLRGALVREKVFGNGSLNDKRSIDAIIKKVLAKMNPDGTLENLSSSEPPMSLLSFGYPGDEWKTPTLLTLLELGYPNDSSEIQNSLDKLSAEAIQKDGRMSVYMLIAAGFVGWRKNNEPAASLDKYKDEWIKWNGSGYCPWGPSLLLKAFWLGRKNTDVEQCITHILQIAYDKMNQAGIVNYRDPWALLDAVGMIKHELAEKIVNRMVPLVLRSQLADGSWGSYSFQVFRALKNKDLFGTLRYKTSLPVDFKISHSIPAPKGNIFSMTWGDENLWLLNTDKKEAVEVSTDNGAITNLLNISLPKIGGITWLHGNLAFIQREPEKHLVLMNPKTGEIVERKPIICSPDLLAEGDFIGVEKVDNEFWISETFYNVILTYHLEGTSLGEMKVRTLGEPGIVDMVYAKDSIWSYDWLTPRILYRSNKEGKLLDWYSIPLDFGEVDGPHCQGLAFDGKNLWALDKANKRICIIERIFGNS